MNPSSANLVGDDKTANTAKVSWKQEGQGGSS